MHHVVLDRWSRRPSLLHARDARMKLLALAAFLVAVATTPPTLPLARAGYALLLVVTLLFSRLPLWGVFTRAAMVLPFAATFALVSFLSGDASRAIALVEKSYLSSLAVLLVVATTPMPKLMRGMESLGVPRFFAMVVQFLYRYLFVISEQAQHMQQAAGCRSGSVRKANAARSQFQNAAGALGVLFARSYARAEGTHQAMLARGFEGHFHLLESGRIGPGDVAFLLVAFSAIALLRLGTGAF